MIPPRLSVLGTLASTTLALAAAGALLCAVDSASAQAPSASREFRMPDLYYPTTEPPRWNSNIPSLTGTPEEAARIRTVAPQWLSKFLSFPAPSEIFENLGKDDPIIREKAANAIRQVLNPSLLPDGYGSRLIPLARWGQLHEDWHRYGGIDIYLTKFSVSNLTVLVAESATHVIVVARDSTFNAKTDSASLRQAAYDYAKILLSSTFVPDVPEDLRTIRQGPSPAFLYGYYTTRLNKLTGRTDDQTTLTETSDSANALSVRFFTNGQMVAFMTLKAVDDPRELGNPFEPRFGLLRDQGEGDPFARPRVEQPGERQLEEYLGLLMTPQEQRTFLELVPMESLEKSFLNLSREQQIAMVRLKMTDESLAAGMKAFLDKKFDDAIQYWLRNLQLDPENPRVGLLLSLAVDRRIERTFGGDRNRARSDSAISQATKAIRDQQVLLKRREESREVVAARERAIVDHRTQALQVMSEGNLEDSLRHWDNILRLDPGNANAQVFRDLVQNRIERGDRRQPSQRLPSSNRTR